MLKRMNEGEGYSKARDWSVGINESIWLVGSRVVRADGVESVRKGGKEGRREEKKEGKKGRRGKEGWRAGRKDNEWKREYCKVVWKWEGSMWRDYKINIKQGEGNIQSAVKKQGSKKMKVHEPNGG